MSWYWYLVGILALAMLMVVHESGHFFVARAFGMRVNKFSIGFGPTFFRASLTKLRGNWELASK